MESLSNVFCSTWIYSSRVSKMANAWITHVKKTMSAMKHRGTYKKGDGLKKVILEAKKTYKKVASFGKSSRTRRRKRTNSIF